MARDDSFVKYKVSLHNSAGELVAETVKGSDNAKKALIEMINDLDYVSNGDKFLIEEVD